MEVFDPRFTIGAGKQSSCQETVKSLSSFVDKCALLFHCQSASFADILSTI